MILAITLAAATFLHDPASSDARAALDRAMDAMGGRAALESIRSVRITEIGHVNLLEQSVRPEGPWARRYEESTELRSARAGTLTRTTRSICPAVGLTEWSEQVFVLNPDAFAAGRPDKLAPASAAGARSERRRLLLSPEHLLLAAAASPTLRLLPDAPLHDVPHNVLEFALDDARVSIYISAETNLPDAVEVLCAFPDQIMWNTWGDVRLRTEYSNWNMESSGARLPHQRDTQWEGMEYQSFTTEKIEINPSQAPGQATIPADVAEAFRSRPQVRYDDVPLGWGARAGAEPETAAEGIVIIPGAWDIALVAQPDGVVVIEGPISSGYSAKVIQEAAKRFPGLPVKAVVTTTDAWPHIAGLREYAARGVPIYALARNRPIVERLLGAHHTLGPDALERSPRQPTIIWVRDRTTIGQGPNRIELFPLAGADSERMMLAYFPDRALLYASDMVQMRPDGTFFAPQLLVETDAAARRSGLSVQRVFAMHTGLRDWSTIQEAIKALGTPPGADESK